MSLTAVGDTFAPTVLQAQIGSPTGGPTEPPPDTSKSDSGDGSSSAIAVVLLTGLAVVIAITVAAVLVRRRKAVNTGTQPSEVLARHENRRLSEMLGDSNGFSRTASSRQRPANAGSGMLVNPLFAPPTLGQFVAAEESKATPRSPRGAGLQSVPAGPEYTAPGDYEVVEEEPPSVAATPLGGAYQALAARPTIDPPRPEAGGAVYDHRIKAVGGGTEAGPYGALDAEGTTWATDKIIAAQAPASTVYNKLHASIAPAPDSNAEGRGQRTHDGYDIPDDPDPAAQQYASAGTNHAGGPNALEQSSVYADPYDVEEENDAHAAGRIVVRQQSMGLVQWAIPFGGDGNGSGGGGGDGTLGSCSRSESVKESTS